MKKFLVTLGVMGVLSSTTVSTMAFSSSVKLNENKVEKEEKSNDIQAFSSTKT